jgi:signal transduction histidine kinase
VDRRREKVLDPAHVRAGFEKDWSIEAGSVESSGVVREDSMHFTGVSSSGLMLAAKNESPATMRAVASLADERTRIAQELHDTLLQGFFALSMQLHVAVDQLPVDCAAAPRFRSIVDLCDRTLEDGRAAIEGLRDAARHGSLGQALASVPSELGLPSAVGFRVIVEGEQRTLKTNMRDDIYRIGREAIVNAYRHSRAEDIEAAIEYTPAELRIAVRDNGCGIDDKQIDWGRRRWGMQGMRERAERIGAHLRIMSRVALGTEVELCVPGRLAFERA